MVRQPRDACLVGRHLAERGVRDVVCRENGRRLAAGVRARCAARARACRCDRGGHARVGAKNPRADRLARRHFQRVRLDHVSERRDRHRHVRRLDRRRGVSPRRAPLSRTASLRQRDGARFPRRADRGERSSGRAGILDVSRPERCPRSGRRAAVLDARIASCTGAAPARAVRLDGDRRCVEWRSSAVPSACSSVGRRGATLANPRVRSLWCGRFLVKRVHAARRRNRDARVARPLPGLCVRQRRRSRLLHSELSWRPARAARKAAKRADRRRAGEPPLRPARVGATPGRSRAHRHSTGYGPAPTRTTVM